MRRYFKPIILVLGIAIIIIAAHYLQVLSPVENSLIVLTQPIQAPLYKLGIGLFNPKPQADLDKLQRDNDALQNRIKQLINENSRLAAQAQEYAQLANQYEYLRIKQYNYRSARVTARSTDQNSQTLIINQGSKSGITLDLPVIVEDGFLIGKIDWVEPDYSGVLLITDNYCQFAAQAQGHDSATGITKGQHGLSLKLELIPKTENLEAGQIIISSGLEENIPANLIIGEVENVEDFPGELWKTATLNTLIDFKKIEIVSVLLP